MWHALNPGVGWSLADMTLAGREGGFHACRCPFHSHRRLFKVAAGKIALGASVSVLQNKNTRWNTLALPGGMHGACMKEGEKSHPPTAAELEPHRRFSSPRLQHFEMELGLCSTRSHSSRFETERYTLNNPCRYISSFFHVKDYVLHITANS